MYNPPHFREERLPVLHQAIQACRLATLVTVDDDGAPTAIHLPMLLDPAEGPYGTLLGHLARGNPQARAANRALAIFPGPEAYVSPAWYPSKRETAKVVPTWNYVAVHASGPLQLFDDAERLLALLTRLTERHEAGRADPWAVADAPADYLRAQMKGIVGIALPIARLEGKWKMSQNKSAADRDGVIAGLKAEGGPAEAAVAAVMEGLKRE